jgi:hypothetical protein
MTRWIGKQRISNWRQRAVLLLSDLASIVDSTVSLVTLGFVCTELRVLVIFSEKLEDWRE